MDSPTPSPTSPTPRRRSTKPRAAANDVPSRAAEPAAAQAAVPEPSFEQIAEAAYHRYLSRGGSDGADFDDWVEAERELRSRGQR